MRTKLLFLFTLCFIALIGLSQPQQQTWYLDNQSIDFRGANPILTQGLIGNVNVAQPSVYHSKNGVHNQNGDLLFYVNGISIINNSGNVLGTIVNPGGASFGAEGELSIVPVPTAKVSLGA